MGLNFLNLMLELLHASVKNQGTLCEGNRLLLVNYYLNFFTLFEFSKSDVLFSRKLLVLDSDSEYHAAKKKGYQQRKFHVVMYQTT